MRDQLSRKDDQKSIVKVKMTRGGRRLEGHGPTRRPARLADFERDGRAAPPVFFRTVPVALTGAAHSCELTKFLTAV